jgi:predicted acylesterase/phospholipase RssA
MIAGTSTGGILACTLTAPILNGKPRKCSDIVNLYRDRGKEIFEKSFWKGFGSLGGVVDEKYDADNLEEILLDYLGETRLSNVSQDLLVTGYQLHTRKPYFFKSWKARGEQLSPNETAAERDFFLHETARATSAAPTYFEPAKLEKPGQIIPLVDGGVFANNPTMCALASARKLYPKKSRFLIVSLGTGETQREIPYKEAKDWGLVGWARPLLYVIFDGVTDAVHYQMNQEFNNRDYFRFQIDLSNDFDDVNAPNDDMDDARPENIQKLEGVAEELIRRERKNLDRLVNQLKNPITAISELR